MKFMMSNMGPLRFAEFELNDLTIISGRNNTGKTYATYGVYGFLKEWSKHIQFDFLDDKIDMLLKNGTIHIENDSLTNRVLDIIKTLNHNYSNDLHTIFGSSKKTFEKSSFGVYINPEDLKFNNNYRHKVFSGNDNLVLSVSGSDDKNGVDIVFVDHEGNDEFPKFFLKDILKQILSGYIFSGIFPNTFILSAERTGASIFRQELDFSRNRLLSEIHNLKNTNMTSISNLLNKVDSSYALPVEDNVDYIRRLEDVSKSESYISNTYPEIIKYFDEISEGTFHVGKSQELYYSPHSRKSLKLPMDDSSSSVRSLLAMGFYLRHTAQMGDLLIIDEPELNLHPDNQRKVARLLAMLVNAGVKVFITTHSDYLIKEFNTLIMLHKKEEIEQRIMESEGYKSSELLDFKQVTAYFIGEKRTKIPGNKSSSKIKTLVQSKVAKNTGIHVESFDTAIEDMNRIQDEILWS